MTDESAPPVTSKQDSTGINSSIGYAAHPFIDPFLFQKDKHAVRYFTRFFRDQMRNDWHYSQLLNRLLHPIGEEHPIDVNERILASYLEDASLYCRELLTLLPQRTRLRFLPDPYVEKCNNLRKLARLIFNPEGVDGREKQIQRFEVQRKLYLAKLLIQIENTRTVQDGPRHRDYLLKVFDGEIWKYTKESWDTEAKYQMQPERNGHAGDKKHFQKEPEAWHFRVKRVLRSIAGENYDLNIYHFDTRFKKETIGFEYTPGHHDYEVRQSRRYSQMKRSRSASVLSKMLRKGINNPLAITDMLGAKFIVAEEKDIHQLAEFLHQILGGPFLFRNQVDLFRYPQDHGRLNRFSDQHFRAFKEDLDILYPSSESHSGRAYSFGVELQIFTVESFLQTVHSQDYSSHEAYKKRQFLQGVLPFVFPASLYGSPDLSGNGSIELV